MTFIGRFPKILGIVFLALVLLAGYLTYAVFSNKFTDYDKVALETSTTGLQLPKRADVKIRGVIVGEVLGAEPKGDGAEVTLGLYPDEIAQIPANVSASILPKTLFGEKFVSLMVPDDPQGEIAAGDTITKSSVSTEVEEVLNDLYPLLRTVQPGELNMTLNAIATALEGRGNQLGENLETIDGYLKRLNPQIPALVEDLRLTSSVSDTYSDILPQVGNILRNTITTTGTLEQKSDKVKGLYGDVVSFSGTTDDFLTDNQQALIQVGQVSIPQLSVLSRYSTEFPCLLAGIVKAGSRQAEAFRNFTLHIVLETIPNQPRAYTSADRPRIAEDRGPNCASLPNPPGSQENPATRLPDFDDGVDTPTGKGTDRAATSYAASPTTATTGTSISGVPGYAGSPQEAMVLKTLLAPSLGTTAEDVPDLGVLLLAPMARGATVSIQ